MKGWYWLLLGILAIVLVRVEHTGIRIDDLEPVETLRIQYIEGSVTIETDTGAKGYGDSLKRAVENLHSSAPSVVFLDTAKYLLLDKNAEALLPELYDRFRPNCLVCRIRGEEELSEATQYLKIHPPETRLMDLRAGMGTLQTLYYQEGRGQLVG